MTSTVASTAPAKCERLGCIALAVKGSRLCAVHRSWNGVERVLGLVRPIVPVATRIEREAQ